MFIVSYPKNIVINTTNDSENTINILFLYSFNLLLYVFDNTIGVPRVFVYFVCNVVIIINININDTKWNINATIIEINDKFTTRLGFIFSFSKLNKSFEINIENAVCITNNIPNPIISVYF
uniref:Uncharacterized protein n=1 Tax=viral metagenome TaxID=1070528 RepID=A0A6C0DJP3_9ZZZZ